MYPFTSRNFRPQNDERSFAAPRTFPDEHIERWAPVYLANAFLRARGVSFEAFLFAPAEILAVHGRPAMKGTRTGLLRKQLDVRDRADLEAALREMGERAIRALPADSHCANGAWTEKLKHHAYPHRRWADRKLVEM